MKLPSKTIENPQTIGEHIRKRRQELKLLQKEVAASIGISEASITLWENSRSKPQIHYYGKIIQFLGYSPFPVDVSTLAGKMKLYRMEHGLTQEEFGKLVGVDECTIQSWENERHTPLPSKRRLLEKIINQKEPL